MNVTAAHQLLSSEPPKADLSLLHKFYSIVVNVANCFACRLLHCSCVGMKYSPTSVITTKTSMVPRPPAAAEILTTTEEEHRPAGRRRSVSVADTSPSVETVMSKAKRAAVSLWMLLHAQVRHFLLFVERESNEP